VTVVAPRLIRVATPADYEALLPIVALQEDSPIDVETLLDRDRRLSDRPLVRFVAEVEGRVVGYASPMRTFDAQANRFTFALAVDPSARGNGLGRRLLTEVINYAAAHAGVEMEAKIREDDPSSNRFADRNGFERTAHWAEMELSLPEFDLRAHQPLIDRVKRSGIRFESFAQSDRSEAAMRRIFDVNYATARDVPGADPNEEWRFEDFRRTVFESRWFRPEGQILALDGDVPVALAAIGETAPARFYHMMTGVLPLYRGRGIASALKVLTVECARSLGGRLIVTHNDSTNAPMLAINRRLGYVARPGWYRISAALSRLHGGSE